MSRESRARSALKSRVLAKVASRGLFRTNVYYRTGLYSETGTWARAEGIFRISLEMDTNLFVTAPSVLREYVFYHESAHAAFRHGFQMFLLKSTFVSAAVTLMAFGLYEGLAFVIALPFFASILRAFQEAQADIVAAGVMSEDRFFRALMLCQHKHRKGIRGILDRAAYGSSPQVRAARAGVVVGPRFES